VSRAREELEALAGRSVGEVTASTTAVPATDVLVGTSAVLHRLSPRDGIGVVAFLDVDQELLAPRVSAGEDALALLAAASRLVGGRAGRVLVQTRVPDHPVVRAALLADPSMVTDADRPLRESLGLPPFGAVAVVTGEGAESYVSGLRGLPVRPELPGGPLAVLGPADGSWMVKAASPAVLADALAAVPRPAGGRGRLRVAVNPARL
jgi:primosomal protein N' (replication factor Y)